MIAGLVTDLILWILLLAAIGFGLIAITGLMIFPDTRSRHFTASRASQLSCGCTAGAVVVFGISALITRGGIQYYWLDIAAISFFVIVLAGNFAFSQKLRTGAGVSEPAAPYIPDAGGKKQE